MTEVGFIGIGAMGRPMAMRLIRGGYDLVAFDIRKSAVEALAAQGAKQAGPAREIVERCETVVLSLPSLGAVRDAVNRNHKGFLAQGSADPDVHIIKNFKPIDMPTAVDLRHGQHGFCGRPDDIGSIGQ